MNTSYLVSTKGGTLTLAGDNLNGITAIKVAGKEVKIVKKSNSEIVIDVSASAEGYPDVEVVYSSGSIMLQRLLHVVKPYAHKRTQKITQFQGNLPTKAGLAALKKMYLKSINANILTCVGKVSSDASASQVAKAKTQAQTTCNKVIKYSKYIKSAEVLIRKTGRAGSKHTLAVTFDRTLRGK